MRILISLFFIVIFITTCTPTVNVPNTTNIKANVVIQRFDTAFFNLAVSPQQKLVTLPARYGEIFDYYLIKNAAQDNMPSGSNLAPLIANLVQGYKPLYDSTQLLYKNLDWLQSDLTQAYKLIKYYYPTFIVPSVVTLVGGFDSENPNSYFGVEYGKNTLLINLQLFMGANFSGYDPQVYYDYIRRRFVKEYILKNSIDAIINTELFVTNATTNTHDTAIKQTTIAASKTLIESMIQAGKHAYLLNAILPYEKDYIKLGFTKAQLKDCEKNEFVIWSHFVTNNNLFETEPSIVKEYVGETPFTKAFGTDSPGNIGAFVGLQIVKKYVSKYPTISIPQLMQLSEMELYTKAGYKPKE